MHTFGGDSGMGRTGCALRINRNYNSQRWLRKQLGHAQRPALGGRSRLRSWLGPGLSPGSGPSARNHKAGRQGPPAGKPHGAARRGRLLSGRCGYVVRAAEAKGTTKGLEPGPGDQLLGTE